LMRLSYDLKASEDNTKPFEKEADNKDKGN